MTLSPTDSYVLASSVSEIVQQLQAVGLRDAHAECRIVLPIILACGAIGSSWSVEDFLAGGRPVGWISAVSAPRSSDCHGHLG